MRNPIKEWIRNVVADDALDRLSDAFDRIEDLRSELASLQRETEAHLKHAEINLTNSLGRVLAEHDRRNNRDAQSLANAMAKEAEYKRQQPLKKGGPYTTAAGIVVPDTGDRDALRRAIRKAKKNA